MTEVRPVRTVVTTPVLVLAALLVLRTVLLFAGDGVAMAIVRLTGRPDAWTTALAWSNLTVVAVDLVTLAVLAGLCRREGRRLRDLLGPVRMPRDLPIGLLVAVIAYAALLVATVLANLLVFQGAPPQEPTTHTLPPLWLGVWSVAIMPVTVALAEELLYRGFLLPRLADRWGWWPAALVVSVGFGLQHAAFSATSLSAVLARVLATAMAGLVFALLARRLGRLLPLVIGHWLVDVVGLGLPILLLSLGMLR